MAKRHGGNISDTAQDALLQVLVGDVQDGGVENGTRIVDLLDHQSVGEGRNSQHVQELEEGSLLGTHTGVLGGHSDIQWSQSTSFSGSLDFVVQEHVSDGDEILLGEDETDVSPDVGEHQLELRVVGQMTTDGFAHHGILAHQDDGMASKGNTDLLHLLRSDIVSIDQEAFGIFIQKLNDFGEVVSFPSGLILPNHLDL